MKSTCNNCYNMQSNRNFSLWDENRYQTKLWENKKPSTHSSQLVGWWINQTYNIKFQRNQTWKQLDGSNSPFNRHMQRLEIYLTMLKSKSEKDEPANEWMINLWIRQRCQWIRCCVEWGIHCSQPRELTEASRIFQTGPGCSARCQRTFALRFNRLLLSFIHLRQSRFISAFSFPLQVHFSSWCCLNRGL